MSAYRSAAEAVTKNKPASGAWGVVLDVDETTLDNSQYQLERGIYGLGYDDASWALWVQRAAAGTVPGVKDFLDAVRALGGKVVFITDRYSEYVNLDGSKIDLVTPTRKNLDSNWLYKNGDLLCLKMNPNDSKAVRRASVAAGSGVCSTGNPLTIVAFVGDQMGDFPQTGESFAGAGKDDQFGKVFFLLPNSMYGRWTNGETRVSGAFK